MSRLSFRPRPLDIYKKLPIVKSVKDLDGDDIASVSKNLPSSSNGVDADNGMSIHRTFMTFFLCHSCIPRTLFDVPVCPASQFLFVSAGDYLFGFLDS
jgi:hypothetical protein